MSAKTSIEWTDRTWNPIRGCSMVSEGCRNCYAMKVATRFSGPGQPYHGLAHAGKWTGTIRYIEKSLKEPLHWKKPCKIFVNSMSDLFHESIPDETIDKIFAVMALSPRHTFQILTKRPERMVKYFNLNNQSRSAGGIWGAMADIDPRWADMNWVAHESHSVILPCPRNVWLGVSVENQKTADERIPLLLETPAAVRFLSCEPLLGPLDLEKYFQQESKEAKKCCGEPDCEYCDGTGWCFTRLLHWVIVGGESGPGARPMKPDWVRSIRDQCQMESVPFFFKQWGEFCGGKYKIGKKRAGAMLDQEYWREFPE